MSEREVFFELSIIDKYLKANLLENLGNDEKRYEYLASTVASLQEKLENYPRLIIQFSLVAFQPHPNTNQPEIILVYEALKQHWKLIDNVYSQDKPIKLLQAVMLETISRVCDSNGRIASIVYHASAGAFPHHKYSLQESLIVKQVLAAAAVKAEKFAATHYLSSTIAKEKVDFTVTLTAPENIAVDRSYLQKGLLAAAGPTDELNQPIPTTDHPFNQYHPNNPPYWNKSFSDIASTRISKLIEHSIETAITEFVTDASQIISERLQEIANYTSNNEKSSAAIERKVLWWMQSLYSPKLHASYRDLTSPTAIIIAMVYDLLEQIDTPVPESVIHILGEAILNAMSEAPAKNRKAIKLSEWLESLQKPDVLTAIEPLAIDSPSLEKQTQSLIAVVRLGFSRQTPSTAMLRDLLDVSLTPRQLGMWLFRDSIAERLVEGE
jgi:hypothetical protein